MSGAPVPPAEPPLERWARKYTRGALIGQGAQKKGELIASLTLVEALSKLLTLIPMPHAWTLNGQSSKPSMRRPGEK